MSEHTHEHEVNISKEIIPLIIMSLIGFAVIWYLINMRKQNEVVA